MVDEVTKKTLSSLPLLKTKASPRDGEQWRQRLKEELTALIQVEFTVSRACETIRLADDSST